MCFGQFNRICHWGPLTALGIIKFVTGTTLHCTGMWWPATSPGGFINTLCFMGLSGLTLYNFLSSMYHGPGFVPECWQPELARDCAYVQYCAVCRGYKAPRSHHCRRCGRCILKMDHHCPWINNCVGWGNHAHFTAFLTYATVGCLQASVILGASLYRAMNRIHYLNYGNGTEPIVHLGLYGVIVVVLALGFTIGVVIAVGMLLFFQIRAILRNRTGIEDWVLEKANYRRRYTNEPFKFPYDLGISRNISQVINLSCQPVGNGIDWPVVDGCDQYTLTREQIAQKVEKRERTKIYNVIRPASGAWFPIMHGLKVCICPPLNDEPRIKLNVGDVVSVTRWRKYWLFGEKQQNLPCHEESLYRVRGWFPRNCAEEINLKASISNEKKIT